MNDPWSASALEGLATAHSTTETPRVIVTRGRNALPEHAGFRQHLSRKERRTSVHKPSARKLPRYPS